MEHLTDLQQYVRGRLAEIEDLDERKFAKEILLEGLLPIFELTERRYLNLEDRIRREREVLDEKYVIYTTIINRADYDPINGTLFPVCPEMLYENGREQESREVDMPYLVYFSGSYEKMREFEQEKKLRARDEKGQDRRVGIRRAGCFVKAVQSLYEVFVYNKIRWTTIHTGYLDRFYEVYTLDDEADVSTWEIDFGSMEAYVQREMIPLWNVEHFAFQCRKFMMPCIDEKYYEHELDLKNYDLESGYMIDRNEDVLHIRYEKDKIIMTSLKESFHDWAAYRFVGKTDTQSHGYQNGILSNARRSSFFEGYMRDQEDSFLSKTKLFWMVQSFESGDCVKLEACEVLEKEPKVYIAGDMNPFLGADIFPMETRKILALRFRRTQENAVFCEDAVRFLVSQIQLSLCEYKCIGVLE